MIPFLISIIILNISISDSNGNTGKAGQVNIGQTVRAAYCYPDDMYQ